MCWLDEDTEAAHLAEITDGDIMEPWEDWNEDWAEEAREEHEAAVKRRKEKILDGILDDEEKYKRNKEAKVGASIECAGPLCHKKFKKIQYSQCFCSSHCKDQFWNRREAHYGYRKPINL